MRSIALLLTLLLPLGLAAQQAGGPPGTGGQQQTGGPPPAGGQPQQGGQQQVAVGGTGGGVVDAANQADPNNVLKATNAREVAQLACSSVSDDHCLDKPGGSTQAGDARGDLTAISKDFNGSVLGADGKDTSALAKAIKSLLIRPINAPDGGTTVWDRQHVKYALVHLVRYDSKANAHDKWILATSGKGDAIELSDSLHIPGAHTIALVFIHTEAKVTVADRQHVTDAFGNISYRAIVAKKLPINIQNLLSLLKLSAGILQGVEPPKVPVNFVGFGVLSKVDVPSDVTVFGVTLSDTDTKLIGQSQKYDNEGKYIWDASVAVPVNKLTLLDYSSDNGGVFTPKTINKQSIYGVINLYPDLVDLKYGNKRWLLPRAIVGIGLTGRPGENFLIGGAWGFQQLQFFVGSAFANHRDLISGADPKSGASYTQRYSSHLSFGINVPVLSAIKKMASANGSNGGSGAGKAKN